MKYVINELILGNKYTSDADAINKLTDAVRAILYFLKVGEFAIDENLYLSLSVDGKKYFIGIKN